MLVPDFECRNGLGHSDASGYLGSREAYEQIELRSAMGAWCATDRHSFASSGGVLRLFSASIRLLVGDFSHTTHPRSLS